MDFSFWNNKKYRYGIIGGALLLITVLALAVRLLPMGDLVGTGDMIAGPDAWYNLRLVEVLLASGGFISFEAMTLFPYGQEIGAWGPLFTYISAFFGMFAGDAGRIALIDAVSWVSAILGALMVPVMFFLGKKLGDWKTGLLAGLFIAVVGGQFFSRTLYGHFDHHVAETLFSTLFALCYILALVHLNGKEISVKNPASLKLPLILGTVSGIAYFLGLLTMTTLVIFGMFVAVFTLIQFVLDDKAGKPTEYLLIINILTFGIGALGLLIYGIKDAGFSFTSYSVALFLVQILVIAGTVFLYVMQKVVARLEKPWYIYLASIVGVAVVGVLALWILLPDLFNSMVGNLLNFFANTETAATVQEMSSWSLDLAASAFNIGLLLALGGFAVLVWKIVRDKSPAALFVLIWSLFTFLATVAHIRWEYFFAVNIALLSAVCVSWTISFAGAEVVKLLSKKQQPATELKGKKGKKAVSTASDKPDVVKIGVLGVVVAVTLIFTGISGVTAVQSAAVYGEVGVTEKDWIESTEWLVEGTPETSIDYYKLYEREGFSYPSEAYGIMSWWDYGHYITTIGKRIPNSNPFQAGVSGTYGAAQVLTATDENDVVPKLNHLKTKYVMTDYQMAGSKFGAMAIWANPTVQTAPFYIPLLQQSSGGAYSVVTAQTEEYFNTLTVRLQNFDGSYTEAGSVFLVLTDSSAGYDYPVITYTKSYTDADAAWKAANEYNAQSSNTNAGKYAYVISIPNPYQPETYFTPNTDIPALKHFRLVHESDTYVVPVDSYTVGVTDANGGGTAWVKTFEYVEGAVIKGNGIISIEVTTNNGRTFTYRQVSENGQFIVPYATGQTGEIKTGIYKIEGSGQTFTVSEAAVHNGLTVN